VESAEQREFPARNSHSEWSEELRARFLGIGMVAVAVACLVFAVARYILQLQSGLQTPWLFNAFGFVAICALYLWYRRAPAARSEPAVHATAAIATVLLIIPVAYGMNSSVWWLTLVGFAMTLMSRRREARLWAVSTVVLVAAVPQLEPLLHVAASAGEQPLESNMARTVFAIILFGIAYAFRREIESKTSDQVSLTADLQAANATKERFLAHMSHELRTPLHSMLGMTELALKQPLDAAQKLQLESVRDSGTTLLNLLNDVLDIGRANADSLALDQQTFALHDVITQLLPPFAAQARQRGLGFDAHADRDLRRWRVGDAARIRQILLKLISNALKFTRSGAIDVQLLPWREHEDGVVLRVADTGIGMAPGLAQRIGKAFVRHDSGPTRSHGGAGLGLALVHELARRMYGRVEFTEGSPQGTIVRVYLRLPFVINDTSIGPHDLLPSRSETPEAASGFERLPAPLRILVCEDDPLSQELMQASLTVLGCSCVVARDGVEGMAFAEDQDFDLVLSDIEMPNMDGYDFLKQFRQLQANRNQPRTPVMAVTAHAAPRDRDRFLDFGFDDYLAKPFTVAELRRMLATVSVTPAHTTP
jgi:signal transduction histidine kinase/CheY-like chemotaxis protein